MHRTQLDAINKEQGSRPSPLAHTLVIVESPTKARTIRGFLPKGFKVEASMGHVRDLPNNASEIPASAKGQKWANLGVNTDADFEPLYVVPKDKKKIVRTATGLDAYAPGFDPDAPEPKEKLFGIF